MSGRAYLNDVRIRARTRGIRQSAHEDFWWLLGFMGIGSHYSFTSQLAS